MSNVKGVVEAMSNMELVVKSPIQKMLNFLIGRSVLVMSNRRGAETKMEEGFPVVTSK